MMIIDMIKYAADDRYGLASDDDIKDAIVEVTKDQFHLNDDAIQLLLEIYRQEQ